MIDLDATYADWYVWARRNLATDSAVCHAAAAAATAVEARGGSRDEAIAAARQSTTSGAHLAPPDPADLRRRSYAEWFDWARRELGGVREQQHAAARAAIAALDGGLGANAAMHAARQAAGVDEPAPAAPALPAAPPPPPPPPAYAPPAYPGPAAYAPPAWPPAPPAPAAFAGYAGFWRRLAAYLIDGVVLILMLLLLSLMAGFFYGIYLGITGGTAPSSEELSKILVGPIYGALFVLTWLYSTLLEASPWQATLGKVALSIWVTDLEGRRIGWGRANARYFSKLLSGSICGVGYLMVAFTERKQGLHDMIAATLVVRKPS